MEQVAEYLQKISRFQESEAWRNHDWVADIDGIDFMSLEQKDNNVSTALRGVQDELEGHRFFVVQQFGDECEADGSIPVSVSLVEGREIMSSFSHMMDEAQPYGPSLMAEIDTGYQNGVQYLLDVTSLSEKGRQSLLHEAERTLDDMSETVSRRMGIGGYSASYEADSGYVNRHANDFSSLRDNAEYRRQERELYGRALDDDVENERVSVANAVQYIVSEAYDAGAKAPYAVMAAAYDKSMAQHLDTEQDLSLQEAVPEQTVAQAVGQEAAATVAAAPVLPEDDLEYVTLYEANLEGDYKKLDELLNEHDMTLLVGGKPGDYSFIIVDDMSGVEWHSDTVSSAGKIAVDFCTDIPAGNNLYGDEVTPEEARDFVRRGNEAAETIRETFREAFQSVQEKEFVKETGKEAAKETPLRDKASAQEPPKAQKAGPKWDKTIFVKPGIARQERTGDGQRSFVIDFTENKNPMRVKIPFNPNIVDKTQEAPYHVKQLYNSQRFRNWVVVEPKDKDVSFTVYDSNNKPVRSMGIQELRDVVDEKNREYDRKHAQARKEPVNEKSGG